MESSKYKVRGWNDINKSQPKVKLQPNCYMQSDECWVLLKTGTVEESSYWKTPDGNGSFGYKDELVTHWAYIKPPPLPKGFKNGSE